MSFVMILFVLCSRFIIRIFTQDEAVVAYGSKALQIIGFGYVFYGIGMVMSQALNGAGDTRTPTIINFCCFWLFQIPFAYFLANTMNLKSTGAFIAIPVTETLIALVSWFFFKRGKWKTVEL